MKKTDKSILLFLITGAIGAFSSVDAAQAKASQRNQATSVVENASDLLTKKIMTKFNGIASLHIPGTFKKIDDYACVRNNTVENVLIENGVEEIGVRAFAKCKNLKVVYIPNSIKKIERNAFYMPNDDLKIVIGGTFQQIQQMYKLLENYIDASQIMICCSKNDSNRVKQKYGNSTIKIINGNIDIERIKTVFNISSVQVVNYRSDISIEIEKLISEIDQKKTGIINEEEQDYSHNIDEDNEDEANVQNEEEVDNDNYIGETVNKRNNKRAKNIIHTIASGTLTKHIISMTNVRNIDWSVFLGEYDENDIVEIKSSTTSYKVTVAEFKKVVIQTKDNLKKNKIKKGNVGKNLDASFKNVIKNRKQITINMRRENKIDVSGIMNGLADELADYNDTDVVSIDINEQIYLLTIASLKSAVQSFATDFYSGKLDENDIYNVWVKYVSSVTCESDDYVADVMIDWSLKESGDTSDLVMKITVDQYIEENTSVDINDTQISADNVQGNGAISANVSGIDVSAVSTPGIGELTANASRNDVTIATVPERGTQTANVLENDVPASSVSGGGEPTANVTENDVPAPNVLGSRAPTANVSGNDIPSATVPVIGMQTANVPSNDVSTTINAIGGNVQHNTGSIVISIPQSMPEHILINVKSVISSLNKIFIGYYDNDVINVTFGEHTNILTVAELKFAVTKMFADFNGGKIVDNAKLEKLFLKRISSLEKARLIREISSSAIANVNIGYKISSSMVDDKQNSTLDVDITVNRISDASSQNGIVTLTIDLGIIGQLHGIKEEGSATKSTFQQAIDEITSNKPDCEIIDFVCDNKNESILTGKIAKKWYDDNNAESKSNYGLHVRGFTGIKKGAFNELSNFTYLSIEDVTGELPKSIFSQCKDLKYVLLPSSITKIGEAAFKSCRSLEKIIISDGVTDIGRSAFEDCFNLSTVIIAKNEGVKIYEKAFKGCRSLTSLHIPNNAEFVITEDRKEKGKSNSVFAQNSVNNLKVYIRVVDKNTSTDKLKSKLVEFGVLEENIFIEDAAQGKTKDIDGLIVSNTSVASLISNEQTLKYEQLYKALAMRPDFQKHFIEGMKGELSAPLHLGVIGEFTVPQTQDKAFSSIQRALFANWAGLNKVIIPDGYKVIEAAAFTNCENLLEVNLADSVEEIQAYTFAGCNKLRSVKLSKGLLSIDNRTFFDCKSLEKILIPDGVSYIGPKSFEGCTALTNVSIPTTVGGIVKDAFKNCPNVKFEIRYVHDDDESEDEAIERVSGLLNKLKK